jgi:hypothetical protein
MGTPSLKQALNRMHYLHAQILRGERLWGGARDGQVRGYMRARRTLVGWGALESDGSLTAFGTELIAAWTAVHGTRPPWAASSD